MIYRAEYLFFFTSLYIPITFYVSVIALKCNGPSITFMILEKMAMRHFRREIHKTVFH